MATNSTPLLDDDLDGSGAPEWFARNAAWITSLLALVATGIAGWYIYQGYQREANETATQKFSVAHQDYQLALNDQDTTGRISKLVAASESAARVAEELGKHPLASKAWFLAGNAAFESAYGQRQEQAVDSLKKAIAHFERYLSLVDAPELKAAGTLAIANCMDNLLFLASDKDAGTKAAKAYSEVGNDPKAGAISLDARLALARLRLAQPGQEAEAVNVLKSVAQAVESAHNKGLTKTLRDQNPASTVTLRTQNQSRVVGQAEMERLRRGENVSFAVTARELIERAPALTTGSLSES